MVYLVQQKNDFLQNFYQIKINDLLDLENINLYQTKTHITILNLNH